MHPGIGPLNAVLGTPPLRVTHIFLDVDGTLVNSSGAAQSAIEAAADRCAALAGREISALDVVRLRQTVRDDPAWRGISTSAIRHETMRLLLEECGLAGEQPIRCLLDAYEGARNRALAVYPDVIEALATLRDLGVVLIAASNGDVDLGCVGLVEFIRDQHYAGDIGVSKPDSRFFSLALSRFGIPPHAALAVGDRLDNDYEPARAAGLYSVLLDRGGEVTDPSISRITSLTELSEIVGATPTGRARS